MTQTKVTKSHDRITLTAKFPEGPVTVRWNRYSISLTAAVSIDITIRQAIVNAASTILKASTDNLGQRIDRAAEFLKNAANVAAAPAAMLASLKADAPVAAPAAVKKPVAKKATPAAATLSPAQKAWATRRAAAQNA